jgi:hypothetical protein
MRILRAATATILTMCLAATPPVDAQGDRVENVIFTVQDGQMHVTYDLIGKGAYEVSLALLYPGGQRQAAAPKTVSGDVGKGVKPGSGKRIIWEAREDLAGLAKRTYVLEVTATRRKGISRWVWAGAATVVAGASAAIATGVLAPGDDPGKIMIDAPDPMDEL